MKLRDSAKCWASVQVQALGYDQQQRLPVYAPRHARQLYGVFGPVARSVPVVLTYRGKKRQALYLVERLKRWGYADVRMQREKKVGQPMERVCRHCGAKERFPATNSRPAERD